jgi:RecA-family ATPase
MEMTEEEKSYYEKLFHYYESKGLCVIPIKKGAKEPLVKWKEYQNRKPTDVELEEIRKNLSSDEINIGVVCGKISEGLVVFDFESESLARQIFTKFDELTKKTFVVKSSKGVHVYFKIKGELPKTEHLPGIDLLSEGSLVVLPPSLHPSGVRYTVYGNDGGEFPPIQTIDEEECKLLIKKIHEIIEKKTQVQFDINKAIEGVPEGQRNETAFSLALRLRRVGLTLEETLSFLSTWNQRNRPPLSHAELCKTVKSAFQYQSPSEETLDLKVMSFEELMSSQQKPIEWLVEGLISKGSIVVIGGKCASLKTTFALYLALCLCHEKPFLGEYKTKKSRVLIIDEENGFPLLKDRFFKLSEGMRVTSKPDIHISSFEGLKLDREKGLEKLKKTLMHLKPDVLIIDSFRRIVSFEENRSEQISQFFTDIVRPLLIEFNLTCIFLHHTRKSISGRVLSDDTDELRGSSDLPNYADTVLMLRRLKGKNNKRIILTQPKNRYGPEIKSKEIEVNWGENVIQFSLVGDAQETLYADESCAEVIMQWITENGIKEFQTRDIVVSMRSEGFSERTTERALSLLVNRGELVKPRRGWYAPSANYNLFGAGGTGGGYEKL